MTNLEFRTELKKGNVDIIYTDIDGKEYVHTILKAGNKEVTLYNNFLNKQYKISFALRVEGVDFEQYKIKQ